MRKQLLAGVVTVACVLALPAAAFAHAHVSPSVAPNTSQMYTLAVPTEKDGLTTTQIKLTVPSGFSIDSYEAEPGWTRTVDQSGTGDDATVNSVTWKGGKTPTDEDSVFRFLGNGKTAKTYTFKVEQTYSDGSVVNWSGKEGSDTPAPTVTTLSNFGNASSWGTGPIVALIVGIVGLLLALVALISRGGGSTKGGKRDLA